MTIRFRLSFGSNRKTVGRLAGCVVIAAFFLLPIHAAGQTAEVPSQSATDSAQTSAAPEQKAAEPLTVVKTLPRAIASDQKAIWSFPVGAAEGHHWKPALAVTLATTGLVFLDSHDTPYFRRTPDFGGFNRAISGRNTSIGLAAVPLVTWAGGWLCHDSYAQKTAVEVGEAYADVHLLTFGMKFATRRLRPSDIPPNGDFGHTWYKSNTNLGFESSFPSGHTITAFSIATIFAERYRRHRWVPWVAYGAATLVAFSRITLQSHFPSDVFAGAAIGYSISHFVVLRRRADN